MIQGVRDRLGRWLFERCGHVDYDLVVYRDVLRDWLVCLVRGHDRLGPTFCQRCLRHWKEAP